MAKEAPGDPKPLLKRQRMWKPNVRPSSPKLCVLAGDAMSGKIKRGSSTLLKTMLMMGGLGDSDGNLVIKRRLGSSRTSLDPLQSYLVRRPNASCTSVQGGLGRVGGSLGFKTIKTITLARQAVPPNSCSHQEMTHQTLLALLTGKT